MRVGLILAVLGMTGCASQREPQAVREGAMGLQLVHVVLNVSDVQVAREFYIGKLGLELIEESVNFFACRAGDVRISVFPGGHRLDLERDTAPNVKFILRTRDLEGEVRRLREKGLEIDAIQEAPGFMRHAALMDPDHNLLFLGEYVSDPMQAHPAARQ